MTTDNTQELDKELINTDENPSNSTPFNKLKESK